MRAWKSENSASVSGISPSSWTAVARCLRNLATALPLSARKKWVTSLGTSESPRRMSGARPPDISICARRTLAAWMASVIFQPLSFVVGVSPAIETACCAMEAP